MATDIVGPASAPNSTTIRPPDTRTFGSVDTWAKDCSSPTANDGTKIQAGWLNGWMGQLRNLIRGNGQTAAAADIVAQDNTDDSMALRSIQHLIQRGLMKYGVDSSVSANTITVSLTPALAEYKGGFEILVKIANTNTGATNININALGNKAVKTITGADPSAGALVAGGEAKLAYDGTNFQIISVLGPAAFSQPKAHFTTAAVNGLAMGVYTTAALTAVSNTDLSIPISGGAITPPAGTYIVVLNAAMRIVVINNTQVAESMRIVKTGGTVAAIDFEATFLLASQDVSIYHTATAMVTMNGTDTLTVQGEVGTTVIADFNLGQIFAGTLDIVRIGP